MKNYKTKQTNKIIIIIITKKEKKKNEKCNGKDG